MPGANAGDGGAGCGAGWEGSGEDGSYVTVAARSGVTWERCGCACVGVVCELERMLGEAHGWGCVARADKEVTSIVFVDVVHGGLRSVHVAC